MRNLEVMVEREHGTRQFVDRFGRLACISVSTKHLLAILEPFVSYHNRFLQQV